MANTVVANGGVDSHVNGSVQIHGVVKEKENLKVEFLEDFESYWEDIHDRLTVSRMVNDSVIRGMVNAVEQEAADKVAHKESEMTQLRESLNLYHLGADENVRIKGSLGILERTAGNQFKMLVEEVDKIRRMNPVKGNAGSDCLQQGDVFEKWMVVDEMLNSLKTTMDTAFNQMNDIDYSSADSLSSWQQEHTFRQEMERVVVASFIRSLKEELEEKLWQQRAEVCSNQFSTFTKNIKEISSLREEMVTISKSLSSYDNCIADSHDCVENGGGRDQKHKKDLRYHISHSSLWEANGKHNGSVTSTPENYDALRHLSADELICRFRTEMNDLKRDYDYRLQTLTEEYFSLKRDYLNLKERGPYVNVKRENEFDAVMKKIPDVVSKLDKILLENKKLVTIADDGFFGTLSSRLDSVQLENHRLKDLVSEKEREVFRLRQEASDATKTVLRLTNAEETLSKSIEKLESVVEDSNIDASVAEMVYKCVLREFVDNFNCILEDSKLENLMVQEVQEIVLRDIASKRASDSEKGFEDTHLLSSITQDLCMVAFREILRETNDKLFKLNMKYVDEKKIQDSLETLLTERENSLRLETEEKERLRQDILSLKCWVDKIEMLLQTAEDAFVKETEKVGQASQELRSLRNIATQQERTIFERNEELRVMQNNLVEASEKFKASESDLRELRQSLELVTETVKKTYEEKTALLAVIQENQDKILSSDSKLMEYSRQIVSLTVFNTELVDGFATLERTVAQNIRKNDTRLKHLCCELSSLTEEVEALKSAESMYKQLLERKSSDLQKAEAEVDLLGDEVDAFWDLLEKIYIALDHYSPVLKHYPGIIEILKLVRRQLSGESR